MGKLEEALIGWSVFHMDHYITIALVVAVISFIVVIGFTFIKQKKIEIELLPPYVVFSVLLALGVFLLSVFIGYLYKKDHIDVLENGIGENGEYVEEYGKVASYKINGNLVDMSMNGSKERDIQKADEVINGCKNSSYMKLSDGKFIVCVEDDNE